MMRLIFIMKHKQFDTMKYKYACHELAGGVKLFLQTHSARIKFES